MVERRLAAVAPSPGSALVVCTDHLRDSGVNPSPANPKEPKESPIFMHLCFQPIRFGVAPGSNHAVPDQHVTGRTRKPNEPKSRSITDRLGFGCRWVWWRIALGTIRWIYPTVGKEQLVRPPTWNRSHAEPNEPNNRWHFNRLDLQEVSNWARCRSGGRCAGCASEMPARAPNEPEVSHLFKALAFRQVDVSAFPMPRVGGGSGLGAGRGRGSARS